jgi:acetoin utilization deacetylase AcuC-like enzyme
VSVDSFDRYEPSGRNTLDMVRDADDYLATIADRLSELDQDAWKPELCLYNSGMDPDARCGIGGLSGISAQVLREREAMVFEWFAERSIPIAFVIAGGYVGSKLPREELVSLHRSTIRVSCLVGNCVDTSRDGIIRAT